MAATTITGFAGLLVAALQALFLLLHPPTGWVLAGLAITAGAIACWSLVDRATPLSAGSLLGVTIAGMAQVALLTALTGGEPERQLLVLWLALGAATGSPRRGLLLLGVAYLAALLPLVGNAPDTHEGTQLLGDALLWAALATLVQVLLTRMHREGQAPRDERSTLGELARRDELTEPGNRRALEETFDEVERAVREGADPCTIAIFNLTGLKQINDRRGQSEGDRCPQHVAQALQHTLAAPAAGLSPGCGRVRRGATRTPASRRRRLELLEQKACCGSAVRRESAARRRRRRPIGPGAIHRARLPAAMAATTSGSAEAMTDPDSPSTAR